MKKHLSLLTILVAGLWINSLACTNFLVTKGASADGSTMISYAADSHVLYGELYYWPAADWAPNTMLDIWEWDTGKYMGQIPQVSHTYNVVGNMNEHQLAIGETTYGGRKELGSQKGAIMDYGSLIYVTLQRAKNAREAIKVMAELMETYGYASSGESFSIADPNEVWIMEVIGKGNGHKGAVWVARMIPDGMVSGHANQARITTFPLDNNKSSLSSKNIQDIFNKGITTVYADDVISFAREMKYFNGKDRKFSFSDTYAPVDFGGARFCEARVWSMFRKVNKKMEKYEDYATGHNLKKRMPLWIEPDHKITVEEMMDFMRDHFEGTVLDMTKDLGAGPFENPYRWRPLTWKVNGTTYCNERAVATQQSGFVFVTQSRNWLPNPIGGIFWFGVDDAATTVFTPMYCGITKVPHVYEVGNGSIMEWSDDAAFWVFNQVSNLAYTRYNTIFPEIQKAQKSLEHKYIDYTKTIDKAATALYNTHKEMGIDYLTDYSNEVAVHTFDTWKTLYRELFVKYMDGNIKVRKELPKNHKYVAPSVSQPGYGEAWYKRIVEETDDHFKMEGGGH
ncbi:MAG: dipeptidase [Bacteroidetes bacterium]|nr:MAG: dipeptidase [Bacteroidota bacterium]PIE88589.1 MAG: dipeptidase [Bacteroidota bacterium]